MPFHASSLAMVQSTETCSTSPACTHGRGRLRACAARIFWVRVIGWAVFAMRPLYMASFPAARNCRICDKLSAMETWFERLSTLDSLFLELEDRTTHMHVGAVAIFEGKPPPYRDFLRLIEARLDQVPR